MSVVRVAIPLLKGKRRFHIEKGRPWSLVEHIVLAAVVSCPRTVSELADKSLLPRRLILEILIRLMRAGWVVLQQSNTGVSFHASDAGKSVVENDELPNVPIRISRWTSFVIDKITGTLYRSRELPFYEEHVLRKRPDTDQIIWLEPVEEAGYDEPSAIIGKLLEDDERFISAEPSADRLVDRFALVTVRNEVVDGLPQHAPTELHEIVKEAAKNAITNTNRSGKTTFRAVEHIASRTDGSLAISGAAINLDDIIIGANEHKDLFYNAIRQASSRIIIHSTFINYERYKDVSGDLYDAARRGVQIDILWGEDDQKTGGRKPDDVARRIRQEILDLDLDSLITMHTFSTQSHAKFIVADDKRSGRYFAATGSCNWLASSFNSIEASIKLRDPRVVSLFLKQISELTRGRDGQWSELTNDVLRISHNLLSAKIPTGQKGTVKIVLGPQHASYVLMARDEAESNIFVTSHRLGKAARPAFVMPAVSAAQNRGIIAKVYFGKADIDQDRVSTITATAAENDVHIRPIHKPRLHAKMLAWDDDNALITSLNWLSADPSDANLRGEIGVYVKANGIGRFLIERLEAIKIA